VCFFVENFFDDLMFFWVLNAVGSDEYGSLTVLYCFFDEMM